MAGGRSVSQRLRVSIKERADKRIREVLEEARESAQAAYEDVEYDGPVNIKVEVKETKTGFTLSAKGRGVKAIEYGADGSEGMQVLYKESDGTPFWYFQPADNEYMRTEAASLKWRPDKWIVTDDSGAVLTDREIDMSVEEYNRVSKNEFRNDTLTRSQYIHTFGEQGDYDDNWIYTEGNEPHYIIQDAIDFVKDELGR